MRKKLYDFFAIPAEIRPDFWQDSMQKNRLSLWVISIMIFGMELFNISRVLFFSKSGLGTLNNRIYFSMYCVLLFGTGLSMLLQYRMRDFPARVQWGIQIGTAAFFFLWHIFLNAYDFVRDPESETYIFVTALVGLAMFIQMPGSFSTIFFTTGYIIFMLLCAPYLEPGVIINITITAIVATAISITRCRHAVIELSQRREINRINAHLQQLLQRDPLTGLLNKKAFQECAECDMAGISPSEPAALFMIDLDDFKHINDHYGHPCGDYVLEQTARRIQKAFPDARYAGRIGGDEFAVLLSNADDIAFVESRGTQFLREFSGISWEGRDLGICCSVGAVWIAKAGLSYERAYQEMDGVLYEAKQGGKNCCCVRGIF